ncbi:peptidylprolyl isomerase [Candidatus Daviesbacteria bacterium RIFCSPHIGHO2_01_FULL_44_29]|uniref:Peptidyl-prolyl cis-trans isomerase n=1 Tax=Candidatus Daviesbacteria bacterium RIFCSPHIGHO2_02_FULL_43_12 TaxID=1797776 RepID=A0A1F5KJ23_9BACT|nr:MAG: peptidylprolyl isomerase [Candidatus Daviesbacteria bacterium RIFCSPHIGHO2_01_FULL_44_29]OGE39141.1 MAG: peptidylprolyl isomerase [Candidatus Daviesbacteria bacterium RIFCSPHIGHO2_12_FULL_47_45]OGE40943.1 MAG: peptidylprolyl isomerase [Candidatus Daviesbacteria bacterium RIFCSPHIGHO2_02_FULL_43_12]OGE69906.1 MAG: peptidylprolyl isomerase [Candidatus Daviesbacteria bacterium RIFCSPLOWO2_01_FULL_43_15]
MSKTQDKFKAEDIKKGQGKEVFGGDHIVIHYKGTLEDGSEFDSSYKRGQPFKTRIGVGQVIEGWDMGVVGMKIGGKRKLTIPSQLAYGDQEIGTIPANSTLFFEVELIDIE